MKVIDIVELTNGSRIMPDVAKELGISKDTLRRRLNSVGYKYDNSLKKTVYKGEESEKNQIDNLLISDLIQKKAENNQKKTEINQKNIRKKSEENQNETVEILNVGQKVGNKSEKNQSDFTESEILALKQLVHIVKSDEAKLFLELASLPQSKESKKSSIVIGKDIHEKFEEFAKPFSNKRISKFSLIELALYEFMKKYS
ncbi:hypothetical protein [Bacillus thuringiensis]|uniref:DNA-binding protein n=2 Tax=Bacillus thuringiensis TaxID=1428 RepID=A0ABD5HS01_BACTU|nr:hypothetical protein [Bacillus thuringiensis]MCR6784515.1 hypothetical protein [Bacillus thuringiensis]MCR6863155.1 hypothetical protein [Bacillus thuringiensis]MCR6869424.1 hypothetical protein [Bacillus thuringiensis]MDW9207708.1 hypothetical protein [Bacillus thuringiensis serovar toumanoffi]MDW9207732.1 hypothetical protein [Bacillus thuringiensis serovar toumanoffi]